MTELPFFYRDDDSGDRKRVGNEIKEGGCKPVLWESYEEMKNSWHNDFVGGATDDQIKLKGKITSGAEDIANLSKIAELERPLALLTNVSDITKLEEKYGRGPTGVFWEYFDKEDCLLDKTFRGFVRECRTWNSPNEEKLTTFLTTIKEMKLDDKSIDVIINPNETTFVKAEMQFDFLRNWNTIGELGNKGIFKDLPPDIQEILLNRLRQYIRSNKEIDVINL